MHAAGRGRRAQGPGGHLCTPRAGARSANCVEQASLRRGIRGIDAVEQAADRLTGVDSLDGLGEQSRDGTDLQFGPIVRSGDGIGGDDLTDHRVVAESLHGLAGKQAMSAGHGGLGAPKLSQLVEQLDDGAARGDLVVENDGAFAGHIAHD